MRMRLPVAAGAELVLPATLLLLLLQAPGRDRCYTHLPTLCDQLHPHHRHNSAISQSRLRKCVSGLQLPALAQGALPGACEAWQAGEAVLWRPTHVRCNLRAMHKATLLLSAGAVACCKERLYCTLTWSIRLAMVVPSASNCRLTGFRQSVAVLVDSFQ